MRVHNNKMLKVYYIVQIASCINFSSGTFLSLFLFLTSPYTHRINFNQHRTILVKRVQRAILAVPGTILFIDFL